MKALLEKFVNNQQNVKIANVFFCLVIQYGSSGGSSYMALIYIVKNKNPTA